MVPNFFEGKIKIRCLGCGDWFYHDTSVSELPSKCPLCDCKRVKQMVSV